MFQTLQSSIKKFLPSASLEPRGPDRGKELKIVVVGGHQSGKSSLIERYVKQRAPSERYNPTVGIHWMVGKSSSGAWCKFWDASHAELGGPLENCLFDGAKAVILTADVTNFSSVQAVDQWRESITLNRIDLELVPLFLFITKSDLSPTPLLSDEALSSYCARSQISGFFRTTAKDPRNVDRAFEMVVESVLAHEKVTERILERRRKAAEREDPGPSIDLKPPPAMLADTVLPEPLAYTWRAPTMAKAKSATSKTAETNTVEAVKGSLASLTDHLAKTFHEMRQELKRREKEEDEKRTDDFDQENIGELREFFEAKREELSERLKSLRQLLDYRYEINRFSDGAAAIQAEARALWDEIEARRVVVGFKGIL